MTETPENMENVTPDAGDPAAADAGVSKEAPTPETEGTPEAESATETPDPVAAVSEERDRYLDALQRLKAEFDNYRKRVDRDREAAQVAGVQNLVSDLLPVIDNLERALGASEGAHAAQILEGVDMVRGQLVGLLSKRGIEAIEAEGQPFDPEVHEAVTQAPSEEHEDGSVMHVIEKGYRMGEVIIRPTKVVVAVRPPGGGE